jgi:hypothetical protein
MMKNISLLKKIKLFRQFKKVVKSSEEELSKQFNIRIDKSYRLYTVLNIPEFLIGESYSLKKSDIDKISENFTRQYTQELSQFLDAKKLLELYEVYEIKKVDKFSYLIVIGFSQFKSHTYYSNIYYKVIPTLLMILTILFLIIL